METDSERKLRILKEASDALDAAQRMNTDRFTSLVFESVTEAFNDVKMPQRQRLIVLASMACAQIGVGSVDDALFFDAILTSLKISTSEPAPPQGGSFEA